MKSYISQLNEQAETDLLRGCLVREYHQARILEAMHLLTEETFQKLLL